MASTAEMPQQDEALKALVSRFKESPERGFIQLASALLSRGHASEALRVAELGLQLTPESVEGRVERAAALLALGRPRVAYVELRRALCIDPVHRRGMRLLGKAFVDAGAPGRAAELLAKRSAMAPSDEPSTSIPPTRASPKADVSDLVSPNSKAAPERPPIRAESMAEPEPDLSPPPSLENVPDLFSDLTKDLGLGAAIPELARRVEVTQIIRRKAMPRPPRSESELREIEGPIVDTTQPGELETQSDEPDPANTKQKRAPLFDAATNPAFEGFSLDDEPLFQEHLPFDVRPVSDSGDVDDTHASEPPTAPVRRSLEAPDPRSLRGHSDLGDTLVEQIESVGTPLAPLAGPRPLAPLTDGLIEDRPARKSGPSEAVRAENLPPVVELSRGRAGRIEIVEPVVETKRVALAVVALLLMLAYFIGLAVFFAEDLARWLPGAPADKGTIAPAPAVEGKSARAQRETAESE